MPAGPLPPRAPADDLVAGRVGRPRRSTPRHALHRHHGGARRRVDLPSWCSSITSAVSNHGAASSAKRIMQHRPDGEVRREQAVAGRERGGQLADVVGRRTPSCRRRRGPRGRRTSGRCARAASRAVKSTATSTPAPAMASTSPTMVTPSTSSPTHPGSTAATSSRSGSAATAPTPSIPCAHRSEHPHADRHDGDPTVGPMRYGLSLPNVGPAADSSGWRPRPRPAAGTACSSGTTCTCGRS